MTSGAQPAGEVKVAEAPAEKQTTVYVVFRQVEDDVLVEGDSLPDNPLWEQLPGEYEVTAGQPKQAIKAATASMPADRKNGTFSAVSVRSWKPIPRKVETREVDDWT